jgi:hypothetical protein
MAVHTVNDDIINSASAQEYFSRADRRVLIGLRAVLEMLSIPVPNYANRKPPGRPPSRAVADAFNADHGRQPSRPAVHSEPLGQRRLAAAVAKAQTRQAARP